MLGARRILRVAIAFVAAVFCAVALVGCPPPPVTSPLITANELKYTPFFVKCGGVGEACCKPPNSANTSPDLGPLVACGVGLGCDITTNTCVKPCGGAGQVCCDGPETRAPKWTSDGKPYSPNTWDMQEMCSTGACERKSHRCFNCGTVDGQACCPPDAAQATARCVGDPRLQCQFSPIGFATSGICIKCGIRGREPCDWGCDPGLDLLKGVCEICGGDGQPPCDKGCKPGLGKIGGICRVCGGPNQIPCDGGCNGGLGLRQGLCVACGNAGQPPCDKGCNPGLRSINGVCQPCGGLNQPPCNNGCNYPYRVSAGVCKPCGHLGQVPCDMGCDGGLTIVNGLCQQPSSPEPQTCAQTSEACVADFVAGKHCCNPPNTSNPLLCVYGSCKTCVPRGALCSKNQTCCTYGDVCRLDVETQKETCGLGG